MRTPTGSLHSAALLVCAVLVLTACSDDPQQPGSLPSDTPSATSSSAVPLPVTPEEQVEATMIAYFEETNEAFKSGDVSDLRRFSTSGCPCRDAADGIEETIKSGGRFEDLRYEVTSVKVHDVLSDTASAEVKAIVPPYKVYDAAGEVIEESNGGTLHTDFSLVKHGNNWIIGNALNLRSS